MYIIGLLIFNFSLNAMNKSYPNTRMRRNRSAKFIRNLVRETSFSIDDLIYPIFILPGKNKEEPIKSMPGKKDTRLIYYYQ